MTFGTIKLWEELENTWTFSYIDDGKHKEEVFQILHVSGDSIAEKNFAQFGSAKSPYWDGKRDGDLAITSEVLELSNIVEWYPETILLHELRDHDDSSDSMLNAEKRVVGMITEASDLTEKQKHRLLVAHLGFFTGNKNFYEERLAKYGKKISEKQLESEQNHYQKISKVVEYLESVVE